MSQTVGNPVERSTISIISWRILPLIGLGYLFSLMDRVNVSFAALQMNEELKFSATVYGIGAGTFYLAYALFEIPSNMLLTRFGARRWLARIMVTWGILAAGMMFVRTPTQFYIMRFLLGAAEAGFFPGVVFYLSHWFPRMQRGRAISRFYFFGPLASTIMGAASPVLLNLHGHGGLSGWQWLFLVEGLPAAFVGIAIFFLLPDAPRGVRWLSEPQKDWIDSNLAADAERLAAHGTGGLRAAVSHPATLRFGFLGMLTIGAMMTYTLSAPLILKGAGFGSGAIGTLVAVGGVLGALGMLATGWVSDRRGERFTTMWISTTLMGLSFALTAVADSKPVFAVAYLLYGLSWGSVTLSQVSAWPDVLHGRVLALGCAAVNTLSQIGAFLMPIGWGRAADATGSFDAGLIGLTVATAIALLMTAELASHVRRTQARVATA
ncbi:MFS transporter [Sphingomonas alba]|uniref:MFS transporter n=1 Tax=Sphingomonas alba TaxID=2908208 RepID=A0ABT0RPR4_9SPHN|nr:MFS transporter [Sphingomonas alba]MCL6684627.1 MFS transporter [Sphingomonas alba]